MSTHATIAVKTKDGNIYAKHSHYGDISDYKAELLQASYGEFFDSVMSGDSAEPFDGSYLDFDHCVKGLGWDAKCFVESMPEHCPKCFRTMEDLFDYAHKSCYADYVYLMDEETESLSIYSYNEFMGYRKWFDEISPFETDLNAQSIEDWKGDFESALEEIDDNANDCEIDLGFDPDIDSIKTYDDCAKFIQLFNDNLDRIKQQLLEANL